MAGEVDVAYVAFDDGPPRAVRPERRARVAVPLDEREVPEAGPLGPERQHLGYVQVDHRHDAARDVEAVEPAAPSKPEAAV